MKKILLSMLVAAFMAPIAAMANNNPVYTPRPGDRVVELPGNTYIVENDKKDNDHVVVIRDGRSLAYRTLFNNDDSYIIRPRNTAPAGGINNACGGEMRVSERNKCVRDMIDAQEEIRKKYQD